jgi:hypothetical protein
MPKPDLSLLIQILNGEQVFDRDTDSRILQAANEVSARLFVEFLEKCDTSAPTWAKEFADQLMEIRSGDPSILVGFDDGRWQGLESGDGEPESNAAAKTSSEFYLRLEFTDADACYYQFHLFPAFDEPFIESAVRKRSDQFQFLKVTLAHPDDLQVFIQNLRGNPHLRYVHDSTEEEFNRAPSQVA